MKEDSVLSMDCILGADQKDRSRGGWTEACMCVFE